MGNNKMNGDLYMLIMHWMGDTEDHPIDYQDIVTFIKEKWKEIKEIMEK